MSISKWVIGAAIALLLVSGAWWVASGPAPSLSQVAEPPAKEAKPELALLTSLPILFPEQFGLDAAPPPVLAALEQRFRVSPVAVTSMSALKEHRLLLMAHPRAQPAEALVDLDGWVRGGGRLLLLADPLLEWPSERALGDKLRPPPAFADTGLLGHWGLTLEALDGEGRLASRSGDCVIDGDGLIARCRLGRGQAVIIADADFLNVDATNTENLDLLTTELTRLSRD